MTNIKTYTALVIGATGATGKYLVRSLLEDDRFSKVSVFVRRNTFAAHPKLRVHLVDFDALEAVQDLLVGDVLFSTLGTTKKDAGTQTQQWKVDYGYVERCASLARTQGVAAMVLLSAMGADAQSSIFYNRLKGSLEQRLSAFSFPTYIIHRPGIIDRPQSTRQGERMALKVLQALNGIGLFQRYAPISTMALATALKESFFHYAGQQKTLSLSEIFSLSGTTKP